MVRRATLLVLALCLGGAFSGTAGADLSMEWVRRADPVLEAGPAGSWDEWSVFGPEVVHDGGQYRMWYTGRAAGSDQYQIGYATSADGIVWTRHAGNPVLTPGRLGSWDEERVWAPTVLFDGSIWRMWYTGYSSATGNQIGYARSADGMHWTKYDGNPVLTPGPAGAWDEHGVASPYVMRKQGIYHLWYKGMDSFGDPDLIGYATSVDGIHWTKSEANPVLAPAPSGDELTYPLDAGSPTVVDLFGDLHVWYEAGYISPAGYEWHIQHATSSDGIHWNHDHVSLPFDLCFCDFNPSVIYYDGSLRMWYVRPGQIYYASAALDVARAYLPVVVR